VAGSLDQLVPVLHLRTADGREFRFTHAFHVGRGADCG